MATQWQVTAGQTVAIVDGERSLDAVAAFHAMHPGASAHVYATPVGGTLTRLGNLDATMDAVLAQAAAPKRTTVKVPAREIPEHNVQVAAVKASRPAKVKVAKADRTKPDPKLWAGEVETAGTLADASTVEVTLVGGTKVGEPVALKVTATAAPVKKGVIGALLALLADGTKRTRPELYDALVVQFPDRASAEGGMRVTIGVQLVALVKKGHSIVSSGAGKDRKYYILQD